MDGDSPYSAAFFKGHRDASYLSAKAVVPHVISLCQPQSVVDFGCGVGPWLRVFLESGITDAVGVDGDYVRNDLLVIPENHFMRADVTQPVDLKRTFDLVVSLEVAEHLPPDRASVFVDTLTRHSGIVLFSAAVPSQGGTYHVNEQWPQYWMSLFTERGYSCIDCLRDVFWEDDRVTWWYRQNMLLFVATDLLPKFPALAAESVRPRKFPFALVHPGFMAKLANEEVGLRKLLIQIPGAVRAGLSRRLAKKKPVQ
jgi:SAM-dependent methyltransferase